MRHLYTLLLITFVTSTQAQITFSNQTTLLNEPTNFHSGVAVGIADMNGDGLDDIVRLNNSSVLSIEYQSAPNQPFANYTHGTVPGNAWAMVVGDVNNDGWNDVLVGGSYDGVKVLYGGANSFTMSLLPVPQGTNGTFVQGSNFADINNDGWLDAFTCHDDGESRIWANNGSGGFANADYWIDMATTPTSDNSGNYGSVWTDFDNDRDLDLYIAKCRQGVNNPADPRRINALFVNDGQNNFSEQAEAHGLKIHWQSWTADFQDIDNDGDMDALVTNHDYPLQLLVNDGKGHFTDIAASAGVDVEGYFIQGIMRDFDNDGFMDIITVGNFNSSSAATHLFRNNGNLTFTKVNSPFGSNSIGSLAVGDLNNDGFLDIYAAYQTSFNNPGNTADRLWMNTTNNGNNHIAFNLQGNASNRMGVGARIEIHGEWGIQIREVRSGESYGIQNSLTQYFGTGSSTEVDYVVVHWPSGTVDVVKNPTINGTTTIVEGSTCSLPGFQLGSSGSAVICPGESLTLTAPAGYDYLWSNGLVGQTISVTTPGNYSLVAVDAQGCAAVSEVLAVVVNPDETPVVTLVGDDQFCQGGNAELASSPAASYAWSTGETTQSITVAQTGDYFVTIEGLCGDFSSQAMHVEVLPAPAPIATNVYIPTPGPATLEAIGENLFWYDSPVATTPLFNGPSFTTPDIVTTATYYVEDAHAYGGGDFSTGMPEQEGSNLYNGANFNGQTIFEVYEPMVLKQVTLNTDQAGVRVIELIKEPSTVVASKSIGLPVGETVADLDFEILEPGNYRLATNTANNIAVLGTMSPRLYRSNQGVSYPYTVPGIMSITDSDLGAGFYYYFFDWKIAAIPQVCISERIPVTATVGVNATGDLLPFGQVSVQPNPSSGLFNLGITAVETGLVQLQITNLAGRVVFGEKFEAVANIAQQRNIALKEVPAGLYFLQLTSGQRSGFVKIVVE